MMTKQLLHRFSLGCISDVRINRFHLSPETRPPGSQGTSGVPDEQHRHNHLQLQQQLLLLHRFQNNHLADVETQNQVSPLNFDLKFRNQNVGVGCPSDECSDPLKPPCPYGLLCVDLWRYSVCQ